MKYYCYRHIRCDKEVPFYIGMGTKRSRNYSSITSEYERAYSKSRRNPYWLNITQQTEYKVEIIFESNSYDEIKDKEKEFISIYKTLLCNMTEGGEGTVGLTPWNKGVKMWEETTHPNYGKTLSEETKRRKSESMKNSGKNLKGKKLPKKWRDNISKSVFGKGNSQYGKKSKNAKKVIDIETSIIYDSIMESAKSTPYQFQYVSAMLNGNKKNKTNLRFYNGL